MHPDLDIAMDMTIGMKTPKGAICTLSLSFNNEGTVRNVLPLYLRHTVPILPGTTIFSTVMTNRSICRVSLVSDNGIELIDREFISGDPGSREPNSSVAQVLPAMETLEQDRARLQVI